MAGKMHEVCVRRRPPKGMKGLIKEVVQDWCAEIPNWDEVKGAGHA